MAQELNIGLMSSFSPVIGTGPEPKSSRPATGKNVELSAPESHGNTERVSRKLYAVDTSVLFPSRQTVHFVVHYMVIVS